MFFLHTPLPPVSAESTFYVFQAEKLWRVKGDNCCIQLLHATVACIIYGR